MAFSSCCNKGHTFMSADIYIHWPSKDGEEAPHCPMCHVEWCEKNDIEASDYMKQCAESMKKYGSYKSPYASFLKQSNS